MLYVTNLFGNTDLVANEVVRPPFIIPCQQDISSMSEVVYLLSLAQLILGG
ncbi:Putative uncharacterized protein [Moritella viscosa]|nr:Putative uncharacterized protein [Moritella viscosa]